MQFSRTLLFILTTFVGLIVYLWMSLGNYDVNDQYAYEKLIRGDEDAGKNHSHTSTQRRIGLQKDLYVNKDGQPLQMLLKSETAELAFEKREGKLDIIEKMHNVTCFVQEEKYFLLEDGREVGFNTTEDGRHLARGGSPLELSLVDLKKMQPMQIISVFITHDASYYYQKNLLVGENMVVTRYLVAGHTLQSDFKPLRILTTGVAEKVNFEIGDQLNFKAEKFKAKIFGAP